MPTKIKEAPRPRGVTGWLLRLPIWLYRFHVGWLLGQRFLLLIHRGRTSGLPRQAVLEVLQYNPACQTYYVGAPWSEIPDWVRNVDHTPAVVLVVGGRRLPAVASRCSPEEAEAAIMAYARRHPFAIRALPRLMGYRWDGTEADLRALARLMLVVAFQQRARTAP